MSLTETLKLTISLLKTHISTVCTAHSFKFEEIEADIAKNITEFEAILHAKSFTSEDLKLIARINMMAKTFYLMLNERLSLQKNIDVSMQPQSIKSPKCDRSFTQERTPPESISASNQRPSRRLAKSQLKILEEWFDYNSENPYLSNSATNMLVSRTNLTVSQVRDWYVSFVIINANLY